LAPSDHEEHCPKGSPDDGTCAENVKFNRIDNLGPYQRSANTEEKIG
jgi:hypothetical protein